MTHVGWLPRARALALVVSAALFAALAGRMMLDSIDVVARERAAVEPAGDEKPALLELADDLVGDVAPAAPSGAGSKANELLETSVRLTLSVTIGPARSEVFVNGGRLGYSPYLGDYTCKRGEALRIEVVPEHGPLFVRHASCAGQNVFIRD